MRPELLAAILAGFALGIAVGVTLEASGALEGLDRAVARRLEAVRAAQQPEDGPNVAPKAS